MIFLLFILFKSERKLERKARENMPEVDMPEHVRLLISWIRLIIATGAFGEDESKNSPMRFVDEWSLIEKICTHAFSEPNEYIRLLIAPYYYRPILENTRYTSDRFIVSAAVRYEFGYIKYASEELRGDREIVLAALRQEGRMLKYASLELRGDRDVVLAAVRRTGYALEFASPELRGDREIVLVVVHKDPEALNYASKELRGDREIIMMALKHSYGCHLLEYVSDDMRKDRDIVLYAVQKNGDSFKYAHEELHKDRDIVLDTVHINGYALQYASEELRGDRDVVLTAVKQNGYALQYASEELWDDSIIFDEASSNIYKQDNYQDGGYSLEFYKNRLYRVLTNETETYSNYYYDDY